MGISILKLLACVNADCDVGKSLSLSPLVIKDYTYGHDVGLQCYHCRCT